MGQVKTQSQEKLDDHDRQPAAPPSPFVTEAQLRGESDKEPLAGCDVEHCQRMHE